MAAVVVMQCSNPFFMLIGSGGPKNCEIVKHEQTGTGFWPIIPVNLCPQGVTLPMLRLLVSKAQRRKDF